MPAASNPMPTASTKEYGSAHKVPRRDKPLPIPLPKSPPSTTTTRADSKSISSRGRRSRTTSETSQSYAPTQADDSDDGASIHSARTATTTASAAQVAQVVVGNRVDLRNARSLQDTAQPQKNGLLSKKSSSNNIQHQQQQSSLSAADATSTRGVSPAQSIRSAISNGPSSSKQSLSGSLRRSASGSVRRLSNAAANASRSSLAQLRGNKSTMSVNAVSSADYANGDGSRTPTPTNSKAGNKTPTNVHRGGDGNTIAQLYAVFGLPKDPSVWTLAEDDCVSGVHHVEGAVGRFWRPEVLGCSICPIPDDVLARSRGETPHKKTESWDGKEAGVKKPQNPKFIEMSDGRGGIEKTETARVLSKALKLSFTREVEIVSGQGNYPPPSAAHTFSFSVPTISTTVAPDQRIDRNTLATGSGKRVTGGVGEGYGLDRSRGASGPNGAGAGGAAGDESGIATFYGVVLTVWSAADERRSQTIRRELQKAAKARTGGSSRNARKGSSAGYDANGAADDDDGHGNGSLDGGEFGFLPANNTFFIPYGICIVSRYPIYNLLSDWNRVAWHKYSRNIEMHNQLMSTILRHPAPRLGDKFIIAATTEAQTRAREAAGAPLVQPDEVRFRCTFPGALEWGRGTIGTDFTMWPLFKTLSVDNILTICEIALAPSGRILFLSRHPALLGLAVESIKYLVELRGWHGVANQNCHARDVRIYLEDPGNWIIAINTELRSIAKPSPQICVVDLDINFVNCPRPPVNAVSVKSTREKKRRRLIAALGFSTADYGPPREFVDAYPGGRFRPLSEVVPAEGADAPVERLHPPVWWDPGAVVSAFDKVLHEGARPTFLSKVLKTRASRSSIVASENEIAAISALRRRASTFVDARDGLENKIGRLNKRLAFLMSESDMWRQQFERIQALVDRLTREANDVRSKLDKERRESRRLSTSLQARDMEHVQLQLQLRDTEQAREAAKLEMAKMQQAMDKLEQEREAMMDEIRGVISGENDGGDDDVSAALDRLSLYSFARNTNGGSRSSSPSGSASNASHTTSNAAEMIAKARALAEARINEGSGAAPSSSGHGEHKKRTSRDVEARVGPRTSSMAAHDASFRKPLGSPTGSAANHFADDQMNYEIQHRTSVVTDQISRIQAQLESTLNNLEGRRSGTYERTRGARKRSSVSSVSSAHGSLAPRRVVRRPSGYEDDASNSGHEGGGSESGYASYASAAHESGTSTNPTSLASGGAADEDRAALVSPSSSSRRSTYERIEKLDERNSNSNAPHLRRSSSNNSLDAPNGHAAGGATSPHQTRGTRGPYPPSASRVVQERPKERQHSNPWKEAAASSSAGSTKGE